jgi:hypothetical protein
MKQRTAAKCQTDHLLEVVSIYVEMPGTSDGTSLRTRTVDSFHDFCGRARKPLIFKDLLTSHLGLCEKKPERTQNVSRQTPKFPLKTSNNTFY